MGPDTVQRQTVNVRTLLDSLRVEFPLSARSRGVTLDAVALSGELEADASLVRRLLVSLVDHALRRAPDGTDVALVVSPRRGYTEFRITDQGPPLALEARRGIFALDSGGLRERGFGLPYCRLVAEAQGGKFWIEDTAAGAVVCLALPTAAAPTHPGPARTQSGMQVRVPAASPRTILVVDDEPLMRSFVSRGLKGQGYGVIEADCADRALDRLALRKQPLTLLLSDVGLPGASGAELVRQAKLLRPNLSTLLMSATPKHSLVQEGVIRSATDLLQKPFSIADLSAKLEALLLQSSSAMRRAQ